MTDDAKILSFPCGHEHALEPDVPRPANPEVIEMLEAFLAMAKRGEIISAGVAAVSLDGNAFEKFSMIRMHGLTFLGSVVLMEAIVRQHILATMTMAAEKEDLEALSGKRDRPEPDDKRGDDDGPDGDGEDGGAPEGA